MSSCETDYEAVSIGDEAEIASNQESGQLNFDPDQFGVVTVRQKGRTTSKMPVLSMLRK